MFIYVFQREKNVILKRDVLKRNGKGTFLWNNAASLKLKFSIFRSFLEFLFFFFAFSFFLFGIILFLFRLFRENLRIKKRCIIHFLILYIFFYQIIYHIWIKILSCTFRNNFLFKYNKFQIEKLSFWLLENW